MPSPRVAISTGIGESVMLGVNVAVGKGVIVGKKVGVKLAVGVGASVSVKASVKVGRISGNGSVGGYFNSIDGGAPWAQGLALVSSPRRLTIPGLPKTRR